MHGLRVFFVFFWGVVVVVRVGLVPWFWLMLLHQRSKVLLCLGFALLVMTYLLLRYGTAAL